MANASSFLFLFFFFWLHWVFVAAHGLSLIAVPELLIAVASVVAEHGLSSCGLRALERRLSSCGARA